MSYKLKVMSIVTAILFGVSLVTYYFNYHSFTSETSNAFIPNFQMSAIEKIVLSGMEKGDTVKQIVFVKDGADFILENYLNYPANITSLQDLIFRIMDLEVKELVTTKKELATDLFLADDNYRGRIELYDRNEKKILDFYTGDNKGAGTYVRKPDSDEIFLLKNDIYIGLEKNNYIERSLWNIDTKNIERIVYTEQKVTFTRKGEEDHDFFLNNKKVDEKQFTSFLRGINYLSFDDFIEFNQSNMPKNRTFIEVINKNGMTYNVAVFSINSEYYMMAQLLPPVNKIQLGPESTNEDAKKLNEQVEMERTAQAFNTKHHKYAYKISEYTYKLYTDRNALMTGKKN